MPPWYEPKEWQLLKTARCGQDNIPLMAGLDYVELTLM